MIGIYEQFRGQRFNTDVMEDLSECYKELAQEINRLPESREKDLCLLKLEESMMWAAKCIDLRDDGSYICKLNDW